MATGLTSDTHYGHENIIAYFNRRCSGAAEINVDMARRWNEIVAPDDIGDFAMGDPGGRPRYRAALSRRIALVRINHDKEIVANVIVEIDVVRCCSNYSNLKTTRIAIIEAGAGSFDDQHPAHMTPHSAHIHGKWKGRDSCVNVGLDRLNYTAISLAEARAAVQM